MTFMEKIFLNLNEDEPDNTEILFYWAKLMDGMEMYADPKYDKNSVSNYFYDIVAPLCQAEKLDGFKKGVSFAMRLSAESFATPEPKRNDAERNYKELERPVEEIEAAQYDGIVINEIEALHTGDPLKIGAIFNDIETIEPPEDICLIAADIARTVRKNSPADANKVAAQMGVYIMRYAMLLHNSGKLSEGGTTA